MDLTESFATAVGSLMNNKIRAILTMLGVIIGVGAVIALLSLGEGVESSITAEIQGMGSNLLIIATDQENSSGYLALSNDDLEMIGDSFYVPAVTSAAAEVQGTQEVLYGGEDTRVTVSGVTANYFDVRNLDIALGKALSEEDVEDKARVAVLGTNVVEDLFPSDELPIGKYVRIAGSKYEVIGTLEEEGGMASMDDYVLIPLTTAQSRLYTHRTRSGEVALHIIFAQAVDEDRIDTAVDQIEAVLRDRHGIAYETDDDFQIINQADILDMASTVTGILTLFLGAIAGISLLVGGIGIMNIMLVSVTERTREIGIRKAVGAQKRDILIQFLIEALLICVLGGLLGIGLGIGGAALIGELIEDMTAVVTLDSVAMSFGFAVAVGVIFGLYPAWRASSLRPIEALRYE
jgi:putative ABC transport system permease protein